MFTTEELTKIGAYFMEQKEYYKAVDAFRDAVESSPANPSLLSNLANAYALVEDTFQAKKYFNKALSLEPNLFEANHSLGFIYMQEEDYSKATKHLLVALKVSKSYDLYVNLATVYRKLQDEDKYKFFLEKSLDYSPPEPTSYFNLAISYANGDDYDKAISILEKTVSHFPNHKKSYAMLSLWYRKNCQWDKERLVKPFLESIDPLDEEPQANLLRNPDPEQNQQVAMAWSEMLLEQIDTNPYKGFHDGLNWDSDILRSSIDFKTSSTVLGNTIKVGYISDGFRDFPTGHKIQNLFSNHDKNKFEIYTYMTGENDGSTYFNKIKKDSHNYRYLYRKSNQQVADQIYKDGIDILVDLKGWTKGNRLEVLARRPAKVNVAWLGFPGTTGASFMDYAIVDHSVVPKADEKYWSEKLLFMPNSYQIASPLAKLPTKTRQDNFVFAAYNLPYKITSEVFDTWIDILEATPKSEIHILYEDPIAKDNLWGHAKNRGLKKSRMKFKKYIDKHSHIERLVNCDLALDTSPVNGHTTTIDCLSVNVPVVTTKGTHFASRVSASILKAAGLDEFICNSLKEYKQKSIEYAKNPKQIKDIQSTSLFNTGKFAKDLEENYARIYKEIS